jgi:D-alanine-D-alanine ligase
VTGAPGPVLVLAGGSSHERDVSLRSGRRVVDALAGVGVDAFIRDVDAGLLAALRDDPPAVLLPALHGAPGEDGSLRAVLDLLGLPYVGSAPDACRVAFDKPIAKAVARAAGLRTPDAVTLPHTTFRDLGASGVLEALVARLGLPLMVKPTRGGSALGASVVRDVADLPTAMVAAFAYGESALLERYVEGTEVAVSVVDTGDGPKALPAVEIVPDGGVYDYAARYTAGTTEFFVPARLDTDALDAAARVALRAHEVLGLRDLSRSDLIVTADGGVELLEVNVAPGMTETSLLPLAAEAAGLEPGALYRDLALAAQRRGPGSRTAALAVPA